MNPLQHKLASFSVVLGSKSPRRTQLLRDLGIEFEVCSKDVDESFSNDMHVEDVPQFLAEKKFLSIAEDIDENTFLITADTVVILDNEILHKPSGIEDAWNMLRKLSGKTHKVLTGVCFGTQQKHKSFVSYSNVCMTDLSDEEVQYYIEEYKPFDKAGAYGVQEWIGFVGVESIFGSYYNIMGLPVQALYRQIMNFDV
ncbi:MAG: Maf family nucleotide pyrophosphatase [Bacteroidales bacterium]|jgi:septum formation protein|nr:Maf family nucleotide pyrophosphatase [Bacteroidales bacterium]